MIGVFSGTGAVLHLDVERALSIAGIKYRRVNDELDLEGIDALIVPGGYTVDMWEPLYKNREKIYEFLEGGGRYVGICAGAYLAPDKVILRSGRLPGLGIIDVENTRKSGAELIEITLLSHSLTRDLPPKIKIWYQNGPHIDPRGAESIAIFDDGYSAIVKEGNVILFAVHPEGSREAGIEASPYGLQLLLRALGIGEMGKEGAMTGKVTASR